MTSNQDFYIGVCECVCMCSSVSSFHMCRSMSPPLQSMYGPVLSRRSDSTRISLVLPLIVTHSPPATTLSPWQSVPHLCNFVIVRMLEKRKCGTMWPLQTDSFAPHNALEIHSVVCSSLFLSNIPQHGHSTVSLTHHLLEDTLVVYSLGLLQMKSLWNKVLVLSFFFF